MDVRDRNSNIIVDPLNPRRKSLNGTRGSKQSFDNGQLIPHTIEYSKLSNDKQLDFTIDSHNISEYSSLQWKKDAYPSYLSSNSSLPSTDSSFFFKEHVELIGQSFSSRNFIPKTSDRGGRSYTQQVICNDLNNLQLNSNTNRDIIYHQSGNDTSFDINNYYNEEHERPSPQIDFNFDCEPFYQNKFYNCYQPKKKASVESEFLDIHSSSSTFKSLKPERSDFSSKNYRSRQEQEINFYSQSSGKIVAESTATDRFDCQEKIQENPFSRSSNVMKQRNSLGFYQEGKNRDLMGLMLEINNQSLISLENHKQLLGNYFKTLTNQEYCKILQRCLPNSEPVVLKDILKEVASKLDILMIDQYANYVCPLIYQYLDLTSRLLFLHCLTKSDPVALIKNPIGTFSFQRIIEKSQNLEEKFIIGDYFHQNFIELAQHPQGSHVIYKIISNFEESFIQSYYIQAANNLILLSGDSNGKNIIKIVLTKCTSSILLSQMNAILISNGHFLMQHEYGNFTMQTAIEVWGAEFANEIYERNKNNMRILCKQKTSSRVIEKCVEVGGEAIVCRFIEKLCFFSQIADLMKNKYGNYVLQLLLTKATGDYKHNLLNLLSINASQIKNEKIRTKWESLIENHSERVNCVI